MANVKFTKEIDEQIVLIAKKYGLKPNDLRAIVQIESKGDPYASSRDSSAEGLMQVVDRTGREYGLIGDDKFDIIKNLDAGARLMRDNKNSFIKKFKREPTAGELYFAHQQGFTGSSRVLDADKDANILTVPGMTAKKVEDNGGKTSMTAGEFANKWINKADELANNMNVEYINVPLRTSNSQQARFLNTEKPKLRPDNLEVPVEPTVNTLVPQQTSIPQMRPDNLQQPNIPQLRPDNLSIQEQEVPQPQSFGQAFSQARQQHGGDGGVFEWNGNKYTTDIAKEVPAVAEPMFPREEFVPTVPPRVTSTADSRFNVPLFEGMEILDLGFNDGTNSVPGYNEGTGMISAMDSIAKMREQYVKDLLERSNQQRIETDAMDEDLAFAQPVPQVNSNDSVFSEPVDGSMRFALNTATSLDNRYPVPLTQRQIDTRSNMYSKSTADGSYGDPQAGFSQQPIPMVVNATPPGYDSGPVGTSVNAVPPGYDAGPVVTSVNAVPPGYNAGPSVIPLAEQFPTPGNDSMYVPENNTVSLFDSKGIHIPSGLTLDEMDIDQLKILVNNVQGDVDSVMIQKEIMKRVNQDYTNAQDMANQELQKDGAVSNSTLKTLDNVKTEIDRQKEIETNLVFQDDWENRKKIRDKNRAEESYAKDLNKYKEHNLNLDKKVPPVKESITEANKMGIVNKKLIPESDNKQVNSSTSSLVSETGLTLKEGIVLNSKGEEVGNPPSPPPEAKNKIEGLLKDYFGLEGKDIVKALGYYLMSRATGASHAGSMRWAGGVVLDSAAKREAKEDKLEAKNAKDKDTIDSLVKAGYTRASAESYVKTKLDDVLVKKGSTGMGITKGDIKRIAVEGIDGYSNQTIYQQTRKLSDGNEVEIVRYFDPVEKTYKEVRLQEFENAIIASGGSLNMTPFSQKDMAKVSQEFVGTITTQLSSKLDENNKGLIGNWTSSLNRYFQDQGYDMTDPRITSSLADLSYKAADRAIAFQAANKGKKVNDLSSFVKTMQLEATSMTANDSVWLAKNDKQIPQDKLAELNQVMFNEAEGNLSEVKAAFLSYITEFKTLDESELLRLRPEKNENKFYVYLRDQLGL